MPRDHGRRRRHRAAAVERAAAAAVLPASVNVEGVELSASTYDLTVA